MVIFSNLTAEKTLCGCTQSGNIKEVGRKDSVLIIRSNTYWVFNCKISTVLISLQVLTCWFPQQPMGSLVLSSPYTNEKKKA
jgi:hypothetical protein